jgi:nitrogenase subunit NifH
MIKKNLIKLLILLFFISGCGYSPIFSKKNTSFSIYELSASGNSKLNKIINNRLNNYKGSDGKRKFSLTLETHLNKEIVLRDSKGNPKTYRINLLSNISIKDFDGNVKNKSFSKSVDYNNKSNKSNLKKYENETSKNLAEKIADEIIIYLGSI